MCGIVGFINPSFDTQLNIEKMKDAMVHRGPDGEGTWISEDKSVAFGHRRLSIVDLSATGEQPMLSHNGRYVITYNGEIYNYTEIRDKLIDESCVSEFRGTSDTEVLLEAISAYGIEKTLKLCKGMFALAVYDIKERALWLVRDRVGEKPLYYGLVNDTFVFASDINSVKAVDGFENGSSIDTRVLRNYLRYGYIQAPFSIYKNVRKLEPGTILKIKLKVNKYDNTEPQCNIGTDNSGSYNLSSSDPGFCFEGRKVPDMDKYYDLCYSSYWSVSESALKGEANPFRGTFEEASEELERLLINSIRGQMEADVPVGAFLSAGIDSSSIVSLMQTVNPGKVRTFTIGMWDPSFNEAEIAATIANHLGTDHTQMMITESDAKAVIPKLSTMFGEPYADSSQIPTTLVSTMTRQHVTVALSGDAGDELFCGYTSYSNLDRIWSRNSKLPAAFRIPLSKMLLATAGDNADDKVRARLLGAKSIEDLYVLSEAEGDDLISKDIIIEDNQFLSSMDIYKHGTLKDNKANLMLMDLLQYHPDDILCKVDRTAMSVSLETRVPFLDKDVVEFALSLPTSYKYEDGITKRVLRNILYKYVPREIIDRPKTGFAIPLNKWLLEPEIRKWAESLIEPSLIISQGLLNPEAVGKLWTDFTDRGIWRKQIWHVLMLQQWMMEQ